MARSEEGAGCGSTIDSPTDEKWRRLINDRCDSLDLDRVDSGGLCFVRWFFATGEVFRLGRETVHKRFEVWGGRREEVTLIGGRQGRGPRCPRSLLKAWRRKVSRSAAYQESVRQTAL